MRIFLIALLAAISYAQTVGEITCEDVSGEYTYGERDRVVTLTQTDCEGTSSDGWTFTVEGVTHIYIIRPKTRILGNIMPNGDLIFSNGYIYTSNENPSGAIGEGNFATGKYGVPACPRHDTLSITSREFCEQVAQGFINVGYATESNFEAEPSDGTVCYFNAEAPYSINFDSNYGAQSQWVCRIVEDPTSSPSVLPPSTFPSTDIPTTFPSSESTVQPSSQPSSNPSLQPVPHPTTSTTERSFLPILEDFTAHPSSNPSTAPSYSPSIDGNSNENSYVRMELKMEGVTSENFASLGPPVKKALADQTSKNADEISLLWDGIAIRRVLQNGDSVTAEFIASSGDEMNSLANTISSIDDKDLMDSISKELTSVNIVGVSITEIGEVTIIEAPSAPTESPDTSSTEIILLPSNSDSSDEGPWYEHPAFIMGYVVIWMCFCSFVIVRHVLNENLKKIQYDFKKEEEKREEAGKIEIRAEGKKIQYDFTKEEEKREEAGKIEIRAEGGASIGDDDNYAGQENKPKRKTKVTGMHRRGHSLVDEFDEFYMTTINDEFAEVTGKQHFIYAGGSTTAPGEFDEPRNKQNTL